MRPLSMIAAMACFALSAPPKAAAAWRVDYAPATNLEALDAAAIGTARTRIDFTDYTLTDVELIDALTAAAARGVTVRIYRDPHIDRSGGAVAAALARLEASAGVSVRIKSGPLMHLKSYCIDGRLLRGGLANFSASGLKHQDNDRWETDDPAAVRAFEADFEAMWSRGEAGGGGGRL